MSQFEAKVGDLVMVKGRSDEDASFALVGAVRECGFAYDVFLVHPIEDMAGPMDLVLDEAISTAGLRLVIQMDSRVIVLADDVSPSPWRLTMDILPAARRAYTGETVNQDAVWTGMPLRGQLDQRLVFKREQSLLGDRLAEPYVDLSVIDLVFDSRIFDAAYREESGITLEATVRRLSSAPPRAFSPESVMALSRETARVKIDDPLLWEALSFAAVEAMSAPQSFCDSEDVGVISHDRVARIKRSELARV